MTAYVVIDEVCSMCNGSRRASVRTSLGYGFTGPCLICKSTGTVQRRVTCAGCRHLDTSGINHPFCDVINDERAEPNYWGCASWEAKP